MAGLPRVIQRIFGTSYASSPTGNIAQPGSTAGGTPVYSSDLNVLQALSAWIQGLAPQCVGTQSPVLQEQNAILFTITQQLQYLLTRGVADWITGEVYNLQDYCKRNGQLYVSLIDGNTGQDPLTNSNAWALFSSTMSGPNILKAWVCFDGSQGVGSPCPILGSFGVNQVAKLNTGQYSINFLAGALPTANYGATGSAGSKNGNSGSPGDNNTICFGLTGYVSTKTVNYLSVYCWEPNLAGSGALEDSQAISVFIFGQ